MLMAMDGLFRADLIEWMTSMTYQAASGGGAKHMRELLTQMGIAHKSAADLLADPNSSILDIDSAVIATQRRDFPVDHFTSRSPGACSRGLTRISETVRAAKSGKRTPRATRFSAARRSRSPSTACASASGRCAVTARR
jgi:aspartate-semialdehyde dehydrogenase